MGKLRIEPKNKGLDEARYEELHGILKDARIAARHAKVFWDLDETEKPSKVRKEFLYVAEREKMNVTIRRPRGTNSLELRFEDGGDSSDTPKRIPADESRKRILDVLEKADQPLRKADIVEAAGISPFTWNARIKELLSKGRVIRHGRQRDATYTMAKQR